jgi:hypothetical protein
MSNIKALRLEKGLKFSLSESLAPFIAPSSVSLSTSAIIERINGNVEKLIL